MLVETSDSFPSKLGKSVIGLGCYLSFRLVEGSWGVCLYIPTRFIYRTDQRMLGHTYKWAVNVYLGG